MKKPKTLIALIATQFIFWPCWAETFSIQKPWSDSNDYLLKLYQVSDTESPRKEGAFQSVANSHPAAVKVLITAANFQQNSPLGFADIYHWIVKGRPQIHYNDLSEFKISNSIIAEFVQNCQKTSNSWMTILCLSKETQKYVASHRDGTPQADCKTAAELFGRSFERLGLKGTASQAIDASFYSKKSMFGHTVNQIMVTGNDGTIYSYIIDAGNFPALIFPYTDITSRYHERVGYNLAEIDSPGIYKYDPEPSRSNKLSTGKTSR